MRKTLIVGLVAIGCLGGAEVAGAATTFGGADMTIPPTVDELGNGVTTVVTPTGAPSATAPVSGILVSVRVRTIGSASAGVVRVLHQTAMPDATTYSFLNTAPEIPISVTADATVGGHVTEVLTRRPIAAGDRLSLFMSSPGVKTAYSDVSGECAYLFGGVHPTGTTLNYTTASCNNGITSLSGTIEPDADGDGFGDLTQDLCPTDPTTQGPCPSVATGQRAAALAKCKKKHSHKKRKKCRKRANLLPV
jgi:hypothetical protein